MPNNQKSIRSPGTQNPRDLILCNGQRVLHPKKGIPLIDFYVKKVAAIAGRVKRSLWSVQLKDVQKLLPFHSSMVTKNQLTTLVFGHQEIVCVLSTFLICSTQGTFECTIAFIAKGEKNLWAGTTGCSNSI